MPHHFPTPSLFHPARRFAGYAAILAAFTLAIAPTRGEEPDTAKSDSPITEHVTKKLEVSAPIDASSYNPLRNGATAKQANFEAPMITGPLPVANNATENTLPEPGPVAKDPCFAAKFPPLNALGVGIAVPEGQTPTDFATPCWNQINAGPNGACRCWPVLNFNWDATCLCYNPLYFEEINAERYGYVCGCSCCSECILQPAASAAHFFGTIPALPYCMAAHCPHECIYTLGYYRPGNCVPWRCHWPPIDPLAAAAEGGVWTGLIFAIP